MRPNLISGGNVWRIISWKRHALCDVVVGYGRSRNLTPRHKTHDASRNNYSLFLETWAWDDCDCNSFFADLSAFWNTYASLDCSVKAAPPNKSGFDQNKVIWLYQLSWNCKWANVKSLKVDTSKFSPSSLLLPHRRSTTVSLETYPLYSFDQNNPGRWYISISRVIQMVFKNKWAEER